MTSPKMTEKKNTLDERDWVLNGVKRTDQNSRADDSGNATAEATVQNNGKCFVDNDIG